MTTKNNIKNITSQCQVVHFAWDYEGDLESHSLSQLAAATPHDVSRYISEVSFSKRMGNASGEFEIVLQNVKDWKDVISKGSWVIIYMSQDGGLSIPKGNVEFKLKSGGTGDKVSISALKKQSKKVRCIGYIDTVRARGTTGTEKGELDVEFVVSGRDFGIVYEETEIWHNQILFDNNLLQSSASFLNSQSIKTVDKLLETLHRLVFSPTDLIKQPLKDDSLTSIALQWLLPDTMLQSLGINMGGKTPYYGNIPKLLNFKPVKASFPVENPLALLNGIAWDRLKSHSLDPYHELFAELDDNGHPKLNFRALPWKLFGTNRRFPTINSTIDKFADPKNGLVKIPTLDIMDFDLGEDNHTRYNAYLTTVVTGQVSVQQSLQMIGNNDPKTGFPRLLQNGIRRHGLRLYYRELNALIDLGQEKVNSKLLEEYNNFSIELWARSHEYESGSISIVGNNNIRLGKCIEISEDAPYNANKLFYIEGYQDTFTVEENGSGFWSQSLFVTRGIEKSVLKNSNNIEDRQTPYANKGEFTES